jgi:hypothetical protein
MTDEELKDKVVRLAGHLDEPGRLWAAAWRLDEMTGVTDLFALAR